MDTLLGNLTLGLNPLYLGAIFRGAMKRQDLRNRAVLIPYISGLSFGDYDIDGLVFSVGLNPLYLGAIFRGAAA